MLRRDDLRGRAIPEDSRTFYRRLAPRAALDVDQATAAIKPILEEVKNGGASALLDLCERFDGVRPPSLRVPREAIDRSLGSLEPAVRDALEEAIRRVTIVHSDQRRTETTTHVAPGGTVTEKWIPVERVGLYVPGGLAVYPSSVVMNVVPAQIAGVKSIALASPPQRDHGGLPHPTILAACALLGIYEVYAVGGAQAIAMFAYGARDEDGESVCVGVDMITGPGNVYVAAAKRVLRGLVGIDSEAGPTEIAILADDFADAGHVAADLISQAEHDTLAAALLVTTSAELADEVDRQLASRVAETKHSERITAALTGPQSATILVESIDQGIAVVDAYAAEHLEIQCRNSRDVAERITNAGAIFVGAHSPVSLGDYCAGSNHVLPTGGCACHSSGLSVQTFLRGVHLIEYSESALFEVAPHVVTLARAEDLPAHGEAILARFDV
ncbi:MAG TPA: histidinol dehydrogenase [Candidatus Nanopelagicaceae bacterium]|nr:histidinol dehydrogenase [Candidatus Nanopelagicaceae bacterium]